jgi:hypothetical protein
MRMPCRGQIGDPVADALDVMPHPVAVDQPRAGASVIPIIRPSTCSGTPEIMNFGGSPSRFGQFLPHQIVIAADAAGGDDHRLRAQREFADDPCASCSGRVDAGWFEDPSR